MARHGENIRKRTDGRWEGRYKSFDDERHKTVYRSVYGKSYEEVKEKQAQLRLGISIVPADGKAGTNLIFAQIAEQWLTEISDKRKYSTRVKYETVYRTHLAEAVGNCQISADGISEIQAKISDHLSKAELSESMRKSVYCVANQTLNFANRNYSSAVPLLEKPQTKYRKNPISALSRTEQARLVTYLYGESDKFQVAVLLCLYAGLRLGELCALKWSDLDFRDRTLTVNRTLQRIAVKGHASRTILLETAPKSESSRRVIPLAKETTELLQQLKKDMPYVFGGEKPLEPRTMQYRFKKILQESGIGNRKFHILRHTFATNCVENGMDIKSLSEILGHSDVKITLNRYVHPTMDSKRKQMDSLSGFYGQICG